MPSIPTRPGFPLGSPAGFSATAPDFEGVGVQGTSSAGASTGFLGGSGVGAGANSVNGIGILAGTDPEFVQRVGAYGESDQQGVMGLATSNGGTGVYGGGHVADKQFNGVGLRGETFNGTGIQGQAFGTGMAGRFIGNVSVSGKLSVGNVDLVAVLQTLQQQLSVVQPGPTGAPGPPGDPGATGDPGPQVAREYPGTSDPREGVRPVHPGRPELSDLGGAARGARAARAARALWQSGAIRAAGTTWPAGGTLTNQPALSHRQLHCCRR